MKLLQLGFLLAFTVILLASSFIHGSPVLNESNFNKQYWIEFVIIAYSILGFFLIWYNKDFLKYNFTPTDAIVLLLLIIYWLFVIYQESNFLLKDVPFYYVLYFFISKLLFSNLEAKNIEAWFRFFLSIVPLVILVHIAILITQQTNVLPGSGSSFPSVSTFGNPDMLGTYLVVLMPFCFMQVRNGKILGYAVFLLGLTTLIILQARTSLVAIISCGFLWVLLNKQMKLTTLLILLIVPVLLIFLLIFWHTESVYGRIFIWFVSLKMIAVKPFGWGLFAFEKHYPQFQSSYLSDDMAITKLFSPEVVHSPFNEFLNVGVTVGIIALVLMILLFYFSFYYLLTSKDRLLYPLLSFFIITLFYFPFKITPLVAIIIPLVAWVSNKGRSLFQIQFSKFYASLIFLLVFLVSTLLAFKSFNSFRNYKQWQYSYSLSLEEDTFMKAEQLFAQLYPKLRTDGRFLITYSNLLSGIGKYNEALLLLEEAEKYFCDITLSVKLAELYEWQGLYSEAGKKYDLAISLAPGRMIAAYEKILFLQRTGKTEEAYFASLELLNRPMEVSTYANNYIIKSRLKKIIRNYETRIE